MSFAPQCKPAPAPAPKPAAPVVPVAAPAAPAVTALEPKPLKSSMAGVPVEPAHSPLERQAEDVSRRVAAGEKVATVKSNPTIPGARAAAAPAPGQAAAQPRAPVALPAPAPSAQAAVSPPDAGEPLPDATRRTLESRMGTDFSQVRVHSSAQARQQAQGMGARAFTLGSDVWLGPGESPNDIELMAHELTHVIQQREPGVAARVMRATPAAPSTTATPAATPAPPVDATTLTEAEGQLVPGTGTTHDTIVFDSIAIPGFKLEGYRADLYRRQQRSSVNLQYPRAYSREDVPDVGQRDNWRTQMPKGQIRSILERKETEAHNGAPTVPNMHYFRYRLRNGAQALYFGSLDEIATELTTPTWNRAGNMTLFHVDHVVELQLADYRDSNVGANAMWNYELLEARTNTNSGNDLKNSINRRIQSFVTATHGQRGANPAELKERYNLRFRQANGGLGPNSVRADQYWTRQEIEDGNQLDRRFEASGPSDFGEAGNVRVIGRGGGGLAKSFYWNGGDRAIAPRAEERDWLKPYRIQSKRFNTDADDLNQGFGVFNLNVPADHKAFGHIENETFDIERVPGARFAGFINKDSVRAKMRANLKAKGFSPLEVENFDITDGGLQAGGRVASDIPLLRDANIRWRLVDGGAEIYKTFTGPDLPLPPPFSIDSCDLTLFASTERGLGAEGRVGFSIRGVGQGEVNATAATGAPLTFGGSFDFDTRYFDPARVAFSYNADSGTWSGSGDIGLKPNTLPGIESATGHVQYDGTTIAGSLTVVPKIRAIQQGQLEFSHSEAEGSRFAGTLTLSDQIPNVRSGQLQAVLTKAPGSEDFSFSAVGDLESGFAGFTQRLHVEYRDGGFVVEGQGNFARGMLSGSLMVGATNYAVDDAGQRGTAPTENITAYGTGQVSVTLTPWLTATGRVRFLPNGELELFGELALPPVLNVFDEKSYNRRLASLNLDIPIVGVAVAGQRIGIFATIGAGLDLSAGIGPGQLRDTALSVTYNPSHEDQTAIHGHARFVVPAHAGLRMFVRGALGAGIPVISAELGLEAGGEIGLAGEASAEATVNWSPGNGLVLDALGSIFVEPKFRFDLTGFAEVTADLWITEIELYSKRWNLASFEVGSNLRFGVEFPMHYQEGQPFDVNWDQVRFITPDVDVGQMMHEVIDRVV